MKIGDLCTYAPKSSIKAGEAISNGEYMFFTSSADENKRYSNYQLDCEAIIMGTGGNATLHYYNGKFSTSTDCVVLIPNKHIRCKYLYYFFLCNMVTLENGFKGAGLKHTNKNYISNIEIYNVPNIETQDKIIKVLDMAFGIKFYYQQQFQKLDELVKSRFIEMFGDCLSNPKGWKTKCLEDIADVGSSKRVFVEELREEGIPFFRGTEVGALAEGKSVFPELFITEEHYAALCSATGVPQIGDLLMPSICPDGRIWVVNTDKPFYFKDGRVLWIHTIDAGFNSTFLLYSLKDRIMTDYSSIASGTTFSELKIFSLKKCKVFAAPLKLQTEFAAFVEQTDKSKLAIQQSLEKLETLKKALMQQYFG